MIIRLETEDELRRRIQELSLKIIKTGDSKLKAYREKLYKKLNWSVRLNENT